MRMGGASPKLRLFRHSMPHIPLRYMWGFQQFTLLRSVSFRDPLAAGLRWWEESKMRNEK